MILHKVVQSIKSRPQSYGEYLKSETKRNKKKRLEVIKKWYDYIHRNKLHTQITYPKIQNLAECHPWRLEQLTKYI